jgi:hypothetical protein
VIEGGKAENMRRQVVAEACHKRRRGFSRPSEGFRP